MSIPTEHPFDFDPSYGLDLAALRAIKLPPKPKRFGAFWRGRYARALEVMPQPELQVGTDYHTDWQVFDITYRSTDDIRIGGWLLVPAKGEVRRGLVVGHGYNGRDRPDFDIPVQDTALLFPCLRGLSRSVCPPIAPDSAHHVLHGIGDPDHYVLGGCVEDVWAAVSALTALYPQIAGKIGYSGMSFGGGIGAIAIAFDKRLDRGHLAVPTFGNIPLWLTLPTLGSGNAVQRHLRTHPQAMESMRLFDAALAAKRIKVPMLMALARFDPSVAPPCQFSIDNALPTSIHHETVILDAGHFDYPRMQAQHALLQIKVRDFFRVA